MVYILRSKCGQLILMFMVKKCVYPKITYFQLGLFVIEMYSANESLYVHDFFLCYHCSKSINIIKRQLQYGLL